MDLSMADKKEEYNEESDRKNLYVRVFDDVVTRKEELDTKLVEGRCMAGTYEAEGVARILLDGQDAQSMTAQRRTFMLVLDDLHKQRESIRGNRESFMLDTFAYEADIQMQEDRREEGENRWRRQQAEEAKNEEYITQLQEAISATKNTTDLTRAKVTKYSAYKEYLDRAVKGMDEKGSTVDSVCSRFRDLLTLRLELLLKVRSALASLRRTRKLHHHFVQREKEQEGCALLDLYKLRASRWQAKREMEDAESKMAAVQAVTSSTHAHLTRLRLALSNLYSVARTYQRSLPPLGLDPNPSVVLSRLYNFLQDAITVTQCAAQATSPASSRPTHGSTLSPTHDTQSFSKSQKAAPPSPSVSVPNTAQSHPSSSSGRSSARSRRRRSATQGKSPRSGDLARMDATRESAREGDPTASTPVSGATNASS